MHVIATVVGGEQLIRVLGVAHPGIEIDGGVEVSRGTNPRIHGLPVGLARPSAMIVG